MLHRVNGQSLLHIRPVLMFHCTITRRLLAVLVELATNQPFDAVIGTDDSTLELAAKLAEQTGLQQNLPSAVRIARRKDLSRNCLQQAGMQVPEFTVIKVAANSPS